MTRKRRWLWITLFVFVVLLLASLTTGWNVVLVSQHQYLLDQLAKLNLRETELARETQPWITLLLGSIGFGIALGGLVLFFVRLLKEMRLNQLQSEFLASVTHALKTPIATLELSASLLQSGSLSEEESSRLWLSHGEELRRLKEEVETLLEAARWQSAAVRPELCPLELESWLTGAISRFRTILGPGAKLEREGEPLKVLAMTDQKLLSMILDNLLENARKFSGGTPDITLRTRTLQPRGTHKALRWQIEVQDRGLGFDPADAEKIFRRFFRAKHEAPYAIPGTGLGLYLVASASRLLKIAVHAESLGHGKGSRVILEGAAVERGGAVASSV